MFYKFYKRKDFTHYTEKGGVSTPMMIDLPIYFGVVFGRSGPEPEVRDSEFRSILCSFPYYHFTSTPNTYYFYWLDWSDIPKWFSGKNSDSTIRDSNTPALWESAFFNISDKIRRDVNLGKCKIILDTSLESLLTYPKDPMAAVRWDDFFKFTKCL